MPFQLILSLGNKQGNAGLIQTALVSQDKTSAIPQNLSLSRMDYSQSHQMLSLCPSCETGLQVILSFRLFHCACTDFFSPVQNQPVCLSLRGSGLHPLISL